MGPYDVDRFADDSNARVHVFNSRFFCPGSSHIDAFTTNWSGKNNFVSPPVRDIVKVIKHMELCKAYGTLVIPCWYSAFWWPYLLNNENWAPFIKRVIVLDPYYYSYGSGDIFKGYQRFNKLTLEIDFTRWEDNICPEP